VGPVRDSSSCPDPVEAAIEVGRCWVGWGERGGIGTARPSGLVYGLSAASTIEAVAQSSSSLRCGPTSWRLAGKA
jgi:hypothetical protein